MMNNKEVVKQVIDAFLRLDIETVLSHATDDIQMGWPGFFDLAPGKEALREFFKSVPPMTSATIGDLIVDGDKVAGTGFIASVDENGQPRNCFFCDVYELEKGKVKKISSYMVFEQKQPQ
ncbi:nuclear transport factor 2 family protein [Chitinophaga sp. XS-30]|uniref:nuclear transport factor 2 family protein n=1 Tax=Chitinophaga sp. XS-30 TaxID=2604421 RepID=UPI001AF01D6C|nr:nuclear transport factor 2 family protein [Chitinophaga sp. XS-30]